MTIDELRQELGGEKCRYISQSEREEMENASWRKDPDEYGDMLSLEQARRLSELADMKVAPIGFDQDPEFFEFIESVLNEWDSVTVQFEGLVGKHGYIDAVYFFYDSGKDPEIEEFAARSFKKVMSPYAEDNYGICPFCDDDIVVKRLSEDDVLRDQESDGALLEVPDEFDIRSSEDGEEYIRLWWDG